MRLVELANKNALEEAQRLTDKDERFGATLALLGKMLALEPPRRMESFDISNLSGTDMVASMVVFVDGKPRKRDYIWYRLNTRLPGGFNRGRVILHFGAVDQECTVYLNDMELGSHKVLMGIITVPAEHAQSVADQLIACGIKAIWNFAPTHLDVPAGILVQNENMATSLAVLSVHLQAQIKEEKEIKK